MRRAALLVALAVAFTLGAVAGTEAHVLTFTNARKAAQARADAYARQPTRIKTLMRTDFIGNHRYYAQAEWETPGPYGVSQYHAIALNIRCLYAHTRANARAPCKPFAWVTDVFG